MLSAYLPALVFLALGITVGVVFTMANNLLGPRRPNKTKGEPYECGLPSDVQKSFRFGISFYLIAMGACSSSAGMFNNYAVVAGADKFLPVDVYIPGCPPRPEALMYGIMKLQDKIAGDPSLGWRKRYGAEGTEEAPIEVA